MDPLAGSTWSTPATVAGFAASPPNATLMPFAAGELRRTGRLHVLDIGCGAGRNAVALARLGCDVLGIDLSWPMLVSALARVRHEATAGSLHVALAPMDRLPTQDRRFDLVVAHGIWNLARTAAELRSGVREAARTAKPGAGLFVFTFSRNTLPADAQPVAGEPFVFTQFSGAPQCFLTEEQLRAELAEAGFDQDPDVPLREHNRRAPGALLAPAAPVIYEGAFRLRA
jgi:SAM-dependent methyltransferase